MELEKQLGTKGIATSSKKLLVTKGIAISSKNATSSCDSILTVSISMYPLLLEPKMPRMSLHIVMRVPVHLSEIHQHQELLAAVTLAALAHSTDSLERSECQLTSRFGKTYHCEDDHTVYASDGIAMRPKTCQVKSLITVFGCGPPCKTFVFIGNSAELLVHPVLPGAARIFHSPWCCKDWSLVLAATPESLPGYTKHPKNNSSPFIYEVFWQQIHRQTPQS